MVSTLDFESSDPSSNLGRTYIFVYKSTCSYFSLFIRVSANLHHKNYLKFKNDNQRQNDRILDLASRLAANCNYSAFSGNFVR